MKSGLKSLLGAQLLAASLVLAACSGLPQGSTSTGGTGTSGTFTIGGTVTGLSGTGLVLRVLTMAASSHPLPLPGLSRSRPASPAAALMP